MAKISIQEKIAAMTPEQKRSIGGLYKKYITTLVIIVVIGAVITAGFYFFFSLQADSAYDEYEAISTTIELDGMKGYCDFSLYEKQLESYNRYCDFEVLKPLSFSFGGLILIIGTLATFFVYKKKYPYFSEKAHSYLKKHPEELGDAPTE